MSEDGNGQSASEFEGALKVAAEWIDAIVWGDHPKVWALSGVEGRTELLDIGTKRGMDEGLASRISTDAASPSEMNEFLADLLNGLRAELAGNDLDNVTYEISEEETTPDRAAVKMFVPLVAYFGGTLPIGTVYIVQEGADWKVAKLIPLTSK